jgi:hypothetical protein
MKAMPARRLGVFLFASLFVLGACSTATHATKVSSDASNACDASAISGAVDGVAASSDPAASKASQLDDVIVNILVCESQNADLGNDPADPINLAYAYANVEAGKAYVTCGKKPQARSHFQAALETAKRIVGPKDAPGVARAKQLAADAQAGLDTAI